MTKNVDHNPSYDTCESTQRHAAAGRKRRAVFMIRRQCRGDKRNGKRDAFGLGRAGLILILLFAYRDDHRSGDQLY